MSRWMLVQVPGRERKEDTLSRTHNEVAFSNSRRDLAIYRE